MYGWLSGDIKHALADKLHTRRARAQSATLLHFTQPHPYILIIV